jgi:hypothetical protein
LVCPWVWDRLFFRVRSGALEMVATVSWASLRRYNDFLAHLVHLAVREVNPLLPSLPPNFHTRHEAVGFRPLRRPLLNPPVVGVVAVLQRGRAAKLAVGGKVDAKDAFGGE